MAHLRDRHALVTGGGSGIGAAVAESLAGAGARVTLLGRTEQRLSQTADRIGANFEVADVTDANGLARAIDGVVERAGPVEILVNNAGAADAVPFVKLESSAWDAIIDVNLSGTYRCTSAVIGGMLSGGWGRVVNIASTAALRGYAYVSAYCAAKHGVLGLTRALALEYAQKGITVNAVCPGYTDTDIVARAIDRIVESTGRSREAALAEIVSSNPQGRLIQPDEVARTVLWICDQESINGQAIAVAGGEVM